MIILLDIFGILIILTLMYQAYKDTEKQKKSYILPCFLSFILFYNTFSFFYSLTTNIISNKFLSGILLVFVFNIVFITIFYFIILVLNAKMQHLMLKISPLIKKIFNILIGFLTGYIFVIGSIVALHKNLNNDRLSHSIFYKISHKNEIKTNKFPKIDNLPSLAFFYSEENVGKFNFTEEELVTILKMIRAISNQDAENLITQYNQNIDIKLLYSQLIKIYEGTFSVDKKYIIDDNIKKDILAKIEDKQETVTVEEVKTIADIIENL